MAIKLRQLHRRIRNIHHIRQIAKAMYAISSTQVLLRKRQLLAARPFSSEAKKTLGEIAAWARTQSVTHPFLAGNGKPGHGLLVLNADRGLCGRYVDEVNHAALKFLHSHAQTQLVVVGDKAIRYLRREGWPIHQAYRRLERPSLSQAQRIQEDLLSLYAEVGEIHVVYAEFRGELLHQVRVERLLPVVLPDAAPRELLAEPDLFTLIEELTRIWLLGKVYLLLLEAKTSEHAARRQAMKNATDNADELLQKLTVQYNKARQQRITLELMDIMGGAEAIREET